MLHRILPFCLAAHIVCAQDTDELTRRADQAAAAVKVGKADDLRRIAALEEPGVWLVAHELCARGEADIALALAKAASGADAAALPAYVESRRAKGKDEKTRTTLKQARKTFAARDFAACIQATEDFQPIEGNIAAAYVLSVRAYALASTREITRAHEASYNAGLIAHAVGDLRLL